jgi:hypothetical protein
MALSFLALATELTLTTDHHVMEFGRSASIGETHMDMWA